MKHGYEWGPLMDREREEREEGGRKTTIYTEKSRNGIDNKERERVGSL